MKIIKRICLILTIIGALNWGLIGLLNLNLVTLIFKSKMIVNILYMLIGLTAIISTLTLFDENRVD